MAQENELLKALEAESGVNIDDAPSAPPVKEVNYRKRTVVVAVVTGVLCGSLMFMLGGMLGRSGADAQIAANAPLEVTEVKEKVDVFSQLQDMRESTITSLNAKIKSLATPETSGTKSTLASTISSTQMIGSDKYNAVVKTLVSTDTAADSIQQAISFPDESTDDVAKAAIADLTPNLISDTQTGTIQTTFRGSSPFTEIGKHCEVVSAPTVSIIGAYAPTEGGTPTRVTLALFTPVSDSDGNLATALYLVNLTNGGEVADVAFSGLLDMDTPTVFSDDVAHMASTASSETE